MQEAAATDGSKDTGLRGVGLTECGSEFAASVHVHVHIPDTDTQRRRGEGRLQPQLAKSRFQTAPKLT